MANQTDTLRIAYRWADRNGIGEALPVVRYGSRQWETGNDEEEALAQACSGLQASAISIEDEVFMSQLSDKAAENYRLHLETRQLPANDYIHRDILSPGPNKSKRNAPNVLSTCAFLVMVEIVAGLIWLVAR